MNKNIGNKVWKKVIWPMFELTHTITHSSESSGDVVRTINNSTHKTIENLTKHRVGWVIQGLLKERFDEK